jgi:hypothetical protein
MAAGSQHVRSSPSWQTLIGPAARPFGAKSGFEVTVVRQLFDPGAAEQRTTLLLFFRFVVFG